MKDTIRLFISPRISKAGLVDFKTISARDLAQFTITIEQYDYHRGGQMKPLTTTKVTLKRLHQSITDPQSHLAPLTAAMTRAPSTIHPTLETCQDKVMFGGRRLPEPGFVASGLGVLHLHLEPGAHWAQAWHTLLANEWLFQYILLLYTNPVARALTLVVPMDEVQDHAVEMQGCVTHLKAGHCKTFFRVVPG